MKVWARRIAATLGVIVGACTAGLGLFVYLHTRELPSVSALIDYKPPQVTRIVARDGTVLGEMFTERRTVVPFEAIPSSMKLALLAAEDAGFYQHEGLSYSGMLRALWKNLRGASKQGGSTITQQLVKTALLTPERTFERKLKELLLTRRIETELSKDQILNIYLNTVNFGHGRYGVEEASRYYFGKSISAVTLEEAALLAALPKGPAIYSPVVSLEKARQRRTLVLNQMQDKGFAPPDRVAAAREASITLASEESRAGYSAELAPEVASEVNRELETLARGWPSLEGLTIETTVAPDWQKAARTAIREARDGYRKRHSARPSTRSATAPAKDPEGALVALDARTGEVVAMVGAMNPVPGGLDRTRVHRQPGSTFKPVVYALGIEKRELTAATPFLIPEGIRIADGVEADGSTAVLLRDAVAQSINFVAQRSLKLLGPPRAVEFARSLGIASKLGADLSLALGAYEVTPRELAGAYSVFARGGVRIDPWLVRRVSRGGQVLYERSPPPEQRVMSVEAAFLMTELLQGVVRSGTGRAASALGRPMAGKTGTTNDSRDTWFAGYSTSLVCVTWIGHDDSSPLGRTESGARTALPAWVSFMRAAHEKLPITEFPVPPGIVQRDIRLADGRLAESTDAPESTRLEYFIEGTEDLTAAAQATSAGGGFAVEQDWDGP